MLIVDAILKSLQTTTFQRRPNDCPYYGQLQTEVHTTLNEGKIIILNSYVFYIDLSFSDFESRQCGCDLFPSPGVCQVDFHLIKKRS